MSGFAQQNGKRKLAKRRGIARGATAERHEDGEGNPGPERGEREKSRPTLALPEIQRLKYARTSPFLYGFLSPLFLEPSAFPVCAVPVLFLFRTPV